MPLASGFSRCYGDAGNISKDITGWDVSLTQELLDDSGLDDTGMRRVEGASSSMANFTMHFDTDDYLSEGDTDFGIIVNDGTTNPAPAIRLQGMLHTSNQWARAQNNQLSGSLQTEQGQGGVDFNWYVFERTKLQLANPFTPAPALNIAEVWCSHDVTAAISSTGSDTNNTLTFTIPPAVTNPTTIGIFVRLTV